MHFPAIITKEGSQTLAEFPDCPGCQTFVDAGESIEDMAAEALEGWLEATLSGRDVPTAPSEWVRVPASAKSIWVPVPQRLAVRIILRRARKDAGLTQAQAAKRAGLSQQQVAMIEDPDSNPTIDTFLKLATALGVTFGPTEGRKQARRAKAAAKHGKRSVA